MSKSRRKKNKFRLKNVGRKIEVSIILLILIVLISLSVFWSGMKLKNIKVTGLIHMDAKSLVKKLDLKTGQNLLFLRAHKIRKKLMQIPRVEDAEVEKRIPSQLVLKIKERKPFALYKNNKKDFTLVDERGIPFLKSQRRDLPVIVNTSVMNIPKAVEFIKGAEQKQVKVTELSVHYAGINTLLNINDRNLRVTFSTERDKWEGEFVRLMRVFEYIKQKRISAEKIFLNLDRKAVIKFKEVKR